MLQLNLYNLKVKDLFYTPSYSTATGHQLPARLTIAIVGCLNVVTWNSKKTPEGEGIVEDLFKQLDPGDLITVRNISICTGTNYEPTLLSQSVCKQKHLFKHKKSIGGDK